MNLEEFKQIFWMEWLHRFFGRGIGVAFAIPMIYYIARGAFTKRMAGVLAAFLALGGAQGALGWYMVKSGLEVGEDEVPRVSQYRLAAHLGTAFVIYIGLLWTALRVLKPEPIMVTTRIPGLIRFGGPALFAMTFTTAMVGAFVAGLDAGMVYNEFPWMGWHDGPEDKRRIDPAEYWSKEPAWKNFFENSATVQFNHRWLVRSFTHTYRTYDTDLSNVQGMSTFTFAQILVAYVLTRGKHLPKEITRWVTITGLMSSLQAALGIATLLYLVPTPLAATHQAGSLALLSFSTCLMYSLARARGVPVPPMPIK